jgi:CRISPR/Cas system endoribonuclease Cas6 (RAMP superfamily)
MTTALASIFFFLLSLAAYATREALVNRSKPNATREARMPHAYPTPALRRVTSAWNRYKEITHNA